MPPGSSRELDFPGIYMICEGKQLIHLQPPCTQITILLSLSVYSEKAMAPDSSTLA